MATINSAPVQKASKPAPKLEPMVVRRGSYDGKDTIVVHKTGQESNFKGYAFNGGAEKVKQLFRADKDGDSILLELLKFAIEKGLTMEQAEASVNLLASQFIGYKDDVASDAHQHGEDEEFQNT